MRSQTHYGVITWRRAVTFRPKGQSIGGYRNCWKRGDPDHAITLRDRPVAHRSAPVEGEDPQVVAVAGHLDTPAANASAGIWIIPSDGSAHCPLKRTSAAEDTHHDDRGTDLAHIVVG
ncbi:hypothetical protein GCM10029964_076370 [Kibdelosporangium lantanae]